MIWWWWCFLERRWQSGPFIALGFSIYRDAGRECIEGDMQKGENLQKSCCLPSRNHPLFPSWCSPRETHVCGKSTVSKRDENLGDNLSLVFFPLSHHKGNIWLKNSNIFWVINLTLFTWLAIFQGNRRNLSVLIWSEREGECVCKKYSHVCLCLCMFNSIDSSLSLYLSLVVLLIHFSIDIQTKW